MGPLSYLIAFACIALTVYYWSTNSTNNVKPSDQPSNPTDSAPENFLDFDTDCTIRALRPSDLESIRALVKGSGGCGYFADHSLSPFLDASNTAKLSFGVEHNATKRIICTQCIEMVDAEETGLVVGAMADPKFADDMRIIYMRLSNHIQSLLANQFQRLGKHRTLEVAQNASYLNNETLDWKRKFNLDAMSSANVYYVYEGDGEGDEDAEDGVKVNADFKECDDIERVKAMLSEFGVVDLLLDWRLFQVQCVAEVLKAEMSAKRLSMMANHNGKALCLVFGETDYYVFGADAKEVLSAVRFAVEQSGDANLGVFVSKDMVDANEELRAFMGKALENEIRGLDYDMHIDGH